MNQINTLNFIGLFFILSLFACKVYLQPKSITISGQVIDEIGAYPVSEVLIKINDGKERTITNNEGFFTITSYQKGDNTLHFYWRGKECSIMMIELKEYKRYNFGKIKINAPMTRPMLLKQTTSQ